MAERLGEPGADGWSARAEAMRWRVEQRFWMEDAGFYGIAIDGEGALCTPQASNAGHLLFVGLPTADRAARVTRRLLSDDFDTGWGLRTLAAGASRFNPMSYHNGSVWPHDTSLCVAGMARYGERARRGAGDGRPLPRLAGASTCACPSCSAAFSARAGEPPIAYPVTCMPQAWAAGSVFLMLQACLGLSIDAAKREVRVVHPMLPHGIDNLCIEHWTSAVAWRTWCSSGSRARPSSAPRTAPIPTSRSCSSADFGRPLKQALPQRRAGTNRRRSRFAFTPGSAWGRGAEWSRVSDGPPGGRFQSRRRRGRRGARRRPLRGAARGAEGRPGALVWLER